ncbi:MAG TPA: phytase [Methylibium sp.]|uniref:phytase n=1 Tax=Methylibium sp. TaxID=2067992 RepID=UPI002DBAC12C|nr:phytase [Methylibium sp.]HEU4459606.1 phytase [Methylibium sp.]
MPFKQIKPRRAAGVAVGLALAAVLAQAAPPPKAKNAVMLSGGAWLSLESKALRWLDAKGAEQGKFAVRGKQLDARPDGAGFVAVLLDSNSSQPLLLRGEPAADGRPAQLRTLAALPPTRLNVEALCLHRDAQGLLHLFVIGDDGRAEQWLVQDDAHRLVRERALPQGSESCRADDEHGRLYVSEEALGVWQYDIASEGSTTRRLVAQTAPWGQLRSALGPLALVPGGLAVGDGERLALLQETKGAWALNAVTPAAGSGKLEALAVTPAAEGMQLHWLGEDADGWQSRRLAGKPVAAAQAAPQPLAIVVPRAQTDPVGTLGDAADDPAIWVHPVNPQASRVLGTNKKQGLHVYDLAGRETQFLPTGRLNNVDLRQGLRIDGRAVDVAVATHRDLPGLAVFTIDAEGRVADAARLPLPLKDIYGMCTGRTPAGELDVYANDEDGSYLHVRVEQQAGQWKARELRRFKVATQPEGCVVDEAAERVFVGEEAAGVWALSSRADQPPVLQPVVKVGGLLQKDVEGVGLHRSGDKAFLVISSQGNDSYLVVDAAPPYRTRGAFRIGIDAKRGIDGASETDGLEVTAAALGPDYPRGLLVVQDGHKTLPMGPQNFKYVSWQDVETALGLR